MARGDSSLGVVFRPVDKGRRGPEVACHPSSSLGVVFQSRRPQIGVVDVALRPIGDELTGRPRGAGWWVKKGILTKSRLIRAKLGKKKTIQRKKRKAAHRGRGVGREYGSLPNR